jgi:hypothetical protein
MPPPSAWWVSQGGQVYGPYTDAQVRAFVAEGRLTADMRYSADGGAWRTGHLVPELFGHAPLPAGPGGTPRRARGARHGRRAPTGVPGVVIAVGVIAILSGVSILVRGLLVLVEASSLVFTSGLLTTLVVLALGIGAGEVLLGIFVMAGSGVARFVLFVLAGFGILLNVHHLLTSGHPAALVGLAFHVTVVALLASPRANAFFARTERPPRRGRRRAT